MSYEFVLGFAQDSIMVMLMISAPALIAGLIVGLLISIFQAVTQIQDMTLTFVPKIVIVGITLMVLGGWMLNVLVNYTSNIFINLSYFAV